MRLIIGTLGSSGRGPLGCAASIALLLAAGAGCSGSSQEGPSDGGPHGGSTGAAGTSSAHAGTTGTAGATGTAGTTGTGGAAGAALADLGKACAANTDCTGGTTCLLGSGKSFFGTDGPPNGYCSKSCSADTDCGSGGICADISAVGSTTPMGTCFQTCTFGGAAGTAKCHGRTDVACLHDYSGATPDYCRPLCTQDSDCPGRKCNLADSLCADTAATGDPLGTHCVSDPDSGASSCASFCLAVGGASGGTTAAANFCSIPCVIGNLNACNAAGTGSLSSGGAHGVCAFSDMTAMQGDIGFCAQECDTAADCTDKTDTGVMCDTSVMSVINHGICSWG